MHTRFTKGQQGFFHKPYRRQKEKIMISNYEKQVDIGKAYFLKYDQKVLAAKFRLNMDNNYLYLTYFNTPCRIERLSGTLFEKTTDSWTECRSYETVMTIYDMLCHSTESTLPPLSGKWTPVANFAAAGASPSAEIFSQKYANAFSGKVDAVKKACISIGGALKPVLAGADITAEIPVFSFFPVLFQFWESDEEFPPQIKILWDDQTMRYLNFETTYYLQGDLLKRLQDTLLPQDQKANATQ